MNSLRSRGGVYASILVVFAVGFGFVSAGLAEEAVGFTEVTPNVVVFSTRTGNVVALVGPDGALLIGTPSADSTERSKVGARASSAGRIC